MTRPFMLFMLVGAAACRVESKATDAPAPIAAGSDLLLGACCPATDTVVMRVMKEYEASPEAFRKPELAIFPYRYTSGLAVKDRIVVSDSVAWAALWPRLVGSNSPIPTLPLVDFTKEMLIIVAMGTRNSGGYTISIDSVRMANGAVFVYSKELSPGKTCGTPAMLTNPVSLARVTRTDAPITYKEEVAVTNCGP